MPIKDSGQRRQFESGAVRDIQEGKGRFDLVPLDVVSKLIDDDYICSILDEINLFMTDKDVNHIIYAIKLFCKYRGWTIPNALLELSIHYEEGAKKYGEHNWEKGIPAHCYIDSGVRHLIKCYDVWEDEPHDRAFIWNMVGLIWTISHKSELDDI